jgi:hypothetical protein
LTRQLLSRQMANGGVLVTTRNKQPTSCCILVDEDKILTMGYVTGELRDATKLVRMARFLMFRKKREKLPVILPLRSPLIRHLKLSGLETTAKILVYEKFLG